ncbi:LysR family transcriptional regulator [Bdellovibrio svalbardensis]|uniref:LysR family transcriptional regulator n=1 Tax=Bdellovibrio svalbardensis TaxID=2972972 RepID=A0ABT6DEC5_9BACT|nr:LysR family transcriptional regulator [Bdellovibrio svalbardensis]MDG0815189.1 LysR family transcriptional regulator [Bdellovibrio svalbardensis]
MFNYNHLYYFYVTAKLGGVSNAASYLHISQPSLSSQLKVLESSLGKKLFKKEGRKLQLTGDGEKAFAYARKMFDIAADFAESLKSPTEQLSQRIRIGVSDQVERPFVADLLSPLVLQKKKGPERIFSVSSSSDENLKKALRSQEIDLLLTNRAIYSEDLQELAAVAMPVKLMVSSQSLQSFKMRLSKNTSASDFISAAPWGLVIPSIRMKLRQETDVYMQEIKMRKRIVFESDIMSVVGRAIVDGAGFGFLPVPYLLEEIKLGQVSAIGPKKGYWEHMLYLIARKESNYDEAIEDVRKAVQAMGKLF